MSAGPVDSGLVVPVFFGQHENRLTPKNQLVFPAPFRVRCPAAVLDEGFMLRCDVPTHVNMFSMREFALVYARVKESARAMIDVAAAERRLRAWSAGSHFVQLDAQGRFVLPRALMEKAGIAGPGVTWVGMNGHVELWSPERMKDQQSETPEERQRWAEENQRFALDVGLDAIRG